MSTIGFIGAGNMGYAMMKGAIEIFNQKEILFTDVNQERMQWVHENIEIPFVSSNKDILKKGKYIILAIKPQYYENVLNEIKGEIDSQHIIISIAPGITIESLKQALGEQTKVVRVMPNTPALVGEGMSVLSYSNDTYETEEKEKILSIFKSFGKVEIVEEKLMDAVVPVSGSSPAYVYMFIEALADGGVKLGLTRKLAYQLAAQSVLGSAKMVLETNQHPGELKDAVCSPGGTTIDAVAVLEKEGMRSAVIEAVEACYRRTIELKAKK